VDVGNDRINSFVCFAGCNSRGDVATQTINKQTTSNHKPLQQETIFAQFKWNSTDHSLALFQHAAIVQWGKTHELADHLLLYIYILFCFILS
jgi:hypothetical protein